MGSSDLCSGAVWGIGCLPLVGRLPEHGQHRTHLLKGLGLERLWIVAQITKELVNLRLERQVGRIESAFKL